MTTHISEYYADKSYEVVTGFEGPEKRLEIDFKFNANSLNGLREVNQERWQEMLNYAKCTIISYAQNEYFDAYVLSESSLFVYPFKVMIKTCGTTTLLNCVPKMLEFATGLDLEVEFVQFSRKNYVFPHKQISPHNHWDDEVALLNTIFDGNSYIIGNMNSDHWYLYVADYSDNTRVIMPEKTIEIMMHKLDPATSAQFYKKENTGDKDKFPGVIDLLADSETDEFNFTPCGYSMNGLSKQSYYTIHVTPEQQCSYASFESNISLPSYTELIKNVLEMFKPGSFSVTFFAEKPSAAPPLSDPFDIQLPGYVLKHKSFCELEGNCDVLMINYESTEYATRPKPKKQVKTHASLATQIIY